MYKLAKIKPHCKQWNSMGALENGVLSTQPRNKTFLCERQECFLAAPFKLVAERKRF